MEHTVWKVHETIIICSSNKNDYFFSVVHCSAGIGRTGTLCLVNSLLKKLEKDPQKRNRIVDHYQIVEIVFDELIFMRQFRLGLIQVTITSLRNIVIM